MRYFIIMCLATFTGQSFAVSTNKLDQALSIPTNAPHHLVKSLDNIINFAEIQHTLSSAANQPSEDSNFYLSYHLTAPQTSQANQTFMVQQQPIFMPDITELTLTNSANISAGYQYGRFTAETGLIRELNALNSGDRVYLKGSIMVMNKENFTLSLSAKVEALNNNLTTAYQDPVFKLPLETTTNNEMLNSSLGITGKYSLTKQWSVIGSFTSSYYNNGMPSNALIDNNLAIIGTRYSF